MAPTPLVCPTCGHGHSMSTLEQLSATSPLEYVHAADGDDDTPDYEFAGSSDIDWDSSLTVGCTCGHCGYTYHGEDWVTKLAPLPTMSTRVSVLLNHMDDPAEYDDLAKRVVPAMLTYTGVPTEQVTVLTTLLDGIDPHDRNLARQFPGGLHDLRDILRTLVQPADTLLHA